MKAIVLAFGILVSLPVLALGGLDSSGIGTVEAPTEDLVAQVLSHPDITLSRGAAADVRGGVADRRVLALLLILAEEHTLDWVGPIRTGHSYYVKGTNRVSNHVYGRAVDIIWVDGSPVTPSNLGALQATKTMLSLPSPLRPDQVGSPWMIPTDGVVVFTKDHHDHLHAGWSVP